MIIPLETNLRFRLKNPYYTHEGVIVLTLKQCVAKSLEFFGKEYVLAIIMEVFKDWDKYINTNPGADESTFNKWFNKFKMG